MSKLTHKYSPEIRVLGSQGSGQYRAEQRFEYRAVREPLVHGPVGLHAVMSQEGRSCRFLQRSAVHRRPLNGWVKKTAVDRDDRVGITPEMAKKMKVPKRANRAPKQANEILGKASAHFTQAELDRRSRT